MWTLSLGLEGVRLRKDGSANHKSSVLKKLKAGKKVASICRECGISEATFYNWRAKYGGLELSHLMKLMKLRQLEEENCARRVPAKPK